MVLYLILQKCDVLIFLQLLVDVFPSNAVSNIHAIHMSFQNLRFLGG
jgi:hypothetical protein